MSEFLAKYSTKKVPIIIENNIVEKSWSILDHSKRYLVITDSNPVSYTHLHDRFHDDQELHIYQLNQLQIVGNCNVT